MVNAPLVMPEVVVGLSLLLMMVSVQRALGFPERGLVTIWIGHRCWARLTPPSSSRAGCRT
jgi:putrescine transport system permease protein